MTPEPEAVPQWPQLSALFLISDRGGFLQQLSPPSVC